MLSNRSWQKSGHIQRREKTNTRRIDFSTRHIEHAVWLQDGAGNMVTSTSIELGCLQRTANLMPKSSLAHYSAQNQGLMYQTEAEAIARYFQLTKRLHVNIAPYANEGTNSNCLNWPFLQTDALYRSDVTGWYNGSSGMKKRRSGCAVWSSPEKQPVSPVDFVHIDGGWGAGKYHFINRLESHFWLVDTVRTVIKSEKRNKSVHKDQDLAMKTT